MERRVGYVRVSSQDQNLDRQLADVAVDVQFQDKLSGKDTNRKGLQDALAFLKRGDTLVVHSPDRLARSTEDLLRIVRELLERGVGVQFVHGGLPSFEPGKVNHVGQLILTILGAVATMERALILERQREGIAAAKARGVYAKKLTDAQVAELRQKAAAGVPKLILAKQFGIARSTLYEYLGVAG